MDCPHCLHAAAVHKPCACVPAVVLSCETEGCRCVWYFPQATWWRPDTTSRCDVR